MEDLYSNYLHDALDRIEQTSTVDEFYIRFESVRDLVSSSQPWIPESYFASRFIYGLREDIQPYVIQFHPVHVIDAFQLACIFEYNFSNASVTKVVNDDIDNLSAEIYGTIEIAPEVHENKTVEQKEHDAGEKIIVGFWTSWFSI
ncbi:hypothetical protein ACHQM5_013776 [Ranunculus cassubicifolius]